MTPSPRPVRVLVVDDSVTIRRYLVDVLRRAPDMEVVGEAADGATAVETARRLKPDVITLDLAMPHLDGVASTEQIMAWNPTPILVVSSPENRGEVFTTFGALSAGAVDVLDKPDGTQDPAEWERRFVSAVRVVSRVKVISHPRARLAPIARPLGTLALPPDAAAVLHGPARHPRFVAIGTSTGGPSAVLDVLRDLGPRFDLPVLLVVHLHRAFGLRFAEWLATVSPLPVETATDGMPFPPPGLGRVIVAAPDFHLVVERGRLRLTSGPERHACRPSVDELFESIVREGLAHQCVACVLTGMGSDGARGLLAIRRAGGATIAQDEQSSVVYGMPRAAAVLGAAEAVLPLLEIGPVLRAIRGKER